MTMGNRNRGGNSKNTGKTANKRLTKSTKKIIKKIKLSTPIWYPVVLQMSAICSGN